MNSDLVVNPHDTLAAWKDHTPFDEYATAKALLCSNLVLAPENLARDLTSHLPHAKDFVDVIVLYSPEVAHSIHHAMCQIKRIDKKLESLCSFELSDAGRETLGYYKGTQTAYETMLDSLVPGWDETSNMPLPISFNTFFDKK